MFGLEQRLALLYQMHRGGVLLGRDSRSPTTTNPIYWAEQWIAAVSSLRMSVKMAFAAA